MGLFNLKLSNLEILSNMLNKYFVYFNKEEVRSICLLDYTSDELIKKIIFEQIIVKHQKEIWFVFKFALRILIIKTLDFSFNFQDTLNDHLIDSNDSVK